MIIDTLTLIFGSIIILSAVISVLSNPFLRKTSNNGKSTISADNNEPISVVILAHNNAEALDLHLPAILTQDYEFGFEVIVVSEQGDLATEAVVSHYSNSPRLRSTFVPAHSLFMSKQKLSVSLGVKAAKNEWVILLDAECTPQTDTWLKAIARNFGENTDMVIGYSNYASTAKPFYRFVRLHTMCYLMNQARRGTAYRTNGTNIAFRKSMFVNGDGYRGNLQYRNGEYDFVVNKYAKQGNTLVETSYEGSVREDAPTKKGWIDKNMYYMHIRHYMRTPFPYRLLTFADSFAMHFNYILAIGACAFSAVTHRWILLAVSILSIVLSITARTLIANKKFKSFNEPMQKIRIVPYEISLLWNSVKNTLKYINTDKTGFTTHKL